MRMVDRRPVIKMGLLAPRCPTQRKGGALPIRGRESTTRSGVRNISLLGSSSSEGVFRPSLWGHERRQRASSVRHSALRVSLTQPSWLIQLRGSVSTQPVGVTNGVSARRQSGIQPCGYHLPSLLG